MTSQQSEDKTNAEAKKFFGDRVYIDTDYDLFESCIRDRARTLNISLSKSCTRWTPEEAYRKIGYNDSWVCKGYFYCSKNRDTCPFRLMFIYNIQKRKYVITKCVNEHKCIQNFALRKRKFAETQAELRRKKPKIEIRYCVKSKWALRATWMASEILTSYGNEFGSLTLVPSISGTYQIVVFRLVDVFSEEIIIWDRKKEKRFPQPNDIKTRLKQKIFLTKKLQNYLQSN